MAALDTATKQSLQNALYAYMHQYGGNTLKEARAIAGTILTVREKLGALISKGLEIETWVGQLVEGFDPSRIAERVWNDGEQAIADQAKHWREKLEIKAQATVDAYIQQYLPDLNVLKIQTIVTTVLPLVEEAQISRDEAKRLIKTISSQFDWQSAMERVIDPKWLILATKTWRCLQNREAAAFAQLAISAYVAEFKPSAVEVGEGLIEMAFQKMVKGKIGLDVDVNLDPETQKLLVKQVMFHFNLLEASPVVSKTAREIAQEVHTEITRYRRSQGLEDVSYVPEIRTTDETTGSSALGGAIGIGFELEARASPSAAQPEEPPEDS